MDYKEYMRFKKMTQKDFAKLIDVHPNTVKNWINWHTKPGLEHIKKIEEKTKGKIKFKDIMYYWEAKDKYG
jgi:DNA-binding transcriptional regulator YdaS (Cro superfamily)